MNEDLKFIKSIIKEEIKSWTGYRREIVDDLGEKDFIQEASSEVLSFLINNEGNIRKEEILGILPLLVDDLGLIAI
jgi:hypothetical protein